MKDSNVYTNQFYACAFNARNFHSRQTNRRSIEQNTHRFRLYLICVFKINNKTKPTLIFIIRHFCFRLFYRKSPVWIKYPYLSTRSAASSSSEERSRSDIGYVHGTIKCRIHGSKGARKKGANTDRDDDAGGCDGRNSMRRHRTGHCGCRHRRQRRRRPGKVSIIVQLIPHHFFFLLLLLLLHSLTYSNFYPRDILLLDHSSSGDMLLTCY